MSINTQQERHEELVGKISAECQDIAREHQQRALYAVKWSRALTIPSILIGAMSTSLIGFTNSDNCENGGGYIKISITVLAGMLSVIAGITGVFSFTDKSQQHAVASSRFSALSRKMSMLILSDDPYAVIKLRFDDALNEMSELWSSSPLLKTTQNNYAVQIAEITNSVDEP